VSRYNGKHKLQNCLQDHIGVLVKTFKIVRICSDRNKSDRIWPLIYDILIVSSVIVDSYVHIII
jgi:hypothetical protein